MRSPRQSVRSSRAAALFISMLAGIFLQTGTATAQTAADLAISMYNTPLDVYTNDYMPYTIFVTNLGPGTVSGVVVTNILPSGFSLISASPAYTLSGNTLSFSVGSLNNLQAAKLNVNVKPTNAGSYTFSANVSSSSNTDPNSANNTNGFSVNAGNYLAGNLSVSLFSTQFVDSQTALEGQFIQITNAGTSSVSSARVIVSGLTNQLYTAAGTNNGNPFVIYGSPIAPGQTGNLLLEFNPRGSFPFTNSQLHVYATPLANLSPPSNIANPITPLQVVRITSGLLINSLVVEFPSVSGQSYIIAYSDNPEFANPLLVLPSVTASANETQFIDYGPPVTIGFPTNTTPRYYRIYPVP